MPGASDSGRTASEPSPTLRASASQAASSQPHAKLSGAPPGSADAEASRTKLQPADAREGAASAAVGGGRPERETTKVASAGGCACTAAISYSPASPPRADTGISRLAGATPPPSVHGVKSVSLPTFLHFQLICGTWPSLLQISGITLSLMNESKTEYSVTLGTIDSTTEDCVSKKKILDETVLSPNRLSARASIWTSIGFGWDALAPSAAAVTSAFSTSRHETVGLPAHSPVVASPDACSPLPAASTALQMLDSAGSQDHWTDVVSAGAAAYTSSDAQELRVLGWMDRDMLPMVVVVVVVLVEVVLVLVVVVVVLIVIEVELVVVLVRVVVVLVALLVEVLLEVEVAVRLVELEDVEVVLLVPVRVDVLEVVAVVVLDDEVDEDVLELVVLVAVEVVLMVVEVAVTVDVEVPVAVPLVALLVKVPTRTLGADVVWTLTWNEDPTLDSPDEMALVMSAAETDDSASATPVASNAPCTPTTVMAYSTATPPPGALGDRPVASRLAPTDESVASTQLYATPAASATPAATPAAEPGSATKPAGSEAVRVMEPEMVLEIISVVVDELVDVSELVADALLVSEPVLAVEVLLAEELVSVPVVRVAVAVSLAVLALVVLLAVEVADDVVSVVVVAEDALVSLVLVSDSVLAVVAVLTVSVAVAVAVVVVVAVVAVVFVVVRVTDVVVVSDVDVELVAVVDVSVTDELPDVVVRVPLDVFVPVVSVVDELSLLVDLVLLDDCVMVVPVADDVWLSEVPVLLEVSVVVVAVFEELSVLVVKVVSEVLDV